MPFRIIVADDDQTQREYIREYLARDPELEIVGEAASAEEALFMVSKLHPDLVLMDIVLPGLDGVAATKTIREVYPRTEVILLSSYITDEVKEYAFRNPEFVKSSVILHKQEVPTQLLPLIRTMMQEKQAKNEDKPG